MRLLILLVSLLGSLLFGGALLASYLQPIWIERGAREVIRLQIERKVGEKFGQLSDSRLAGAAQKLLNRTNVDIDESKQSIRSQLPKKLATVMADMLDADCECRKRLIESAERAEEQQLGALMLVKGKLTALIETAYVHTARKLLREFRIFSFSNALAFVLLGVVTLLRKKATLQLLLPAFVLVGAVLISGSMYLFQQNWLHTILFSSYVGWAYSGYLALVAIWLSDIAFNAARVTSKIVNTLLSAVGSASFVSPC